MRSETFIQNTASFDQHPQDKRLLLVENNKIMIYDMDGFQWREQIDFATDMAYWVDAGEKAISIAADGDLVCWDAKNWTQLFAVSGCANTLNNTGIVHQQ